MAKEKIKIGVIPAGGKGTRLGRLGNYLPKSLVPLGQKPILYHIIKNLEMMSIEQIYLLVNYKSNLIKQYLKEENEFNNFKIRFLKSAPDLGLAEVILKTERFIKKPFVTILGDDFTNLRNIHKLKKTNNQSCRKTSKTQIKLSRVRNLFI